MAWKNKYIPINGYARSGSKLTAVRKLVLHYTANHGAGADNHYRYFRDLKGRYASAHIFVDKTESLCIIPLNEVAYHANDGTYRGVPELKPNANYLSIGVEMCQEKDGSFHPDMIKKTEDVFVELCKRYNLDPLKDIVRHYDITRKNCPAPWVSDSKQFTNFKNRVNNKLKGNTKPSTPSTWTSVSGNWTGQALMKWHYGNPVEQLQKMLSNHVSQLLTSKDVDGYYGDKTVQAVKAYQKKYGLKVDGIAGTGVYNSLRGGLTLSEYNELKKIIDAQSKEIQRLKTELDGKINKTSTINTPSESHQEGFDWVVSNGVSNGSNPRGYLTREQSFTLLKKYDELKFILGGEPDDSHKDNWEWAVENGLTIGTNPHMVLTREQMITMLKRYHDNIAKED